MASDHNRSVDGVVLRIIDNHVIIKKKHPHGCFFVVSSLTLAYSVVSYFTC